MRFPADSGRKVSRKPRTQRNKPSPATSGSEALTPTPAPERSVTDRLTLSSGAHWQQAQPAVTEPHLFDLAALAIRFKFYVEIEKATKDLESAGRDALAGAEPWRKCSMLDNHLAQLRESISESAKKWCTELGKLAITHRDKLDELSSWEWAKQQIEVELWGFFRLDTPASRLRCFIRRVCGPLDPAAGPELELWLNDEPVPDEPPARLPWWLDSHRHPRSRGLARHFAGTSELATSNDAQPISPEDTEDFFRRKERDFKSELEYALFDAEADVLVESAQTPAPPAKLRETPPHEQPRDTNGGGTSSTTTKPLLTIQTLPDGSLHADETRNGYPNDRLLNTFDELVGTFTDIRTVARRPKQMSAEAKDVAHDLAKQFKRTWLGKIATRDHWRQWVYHFQQSKTKAGSQKKNTNHWTGTKAAYMFMDEITGIKPPTLKSRLARIRHPRVTNL